MSNTMPKPKSYRILSKDLLPEYLSEIPAVFDMLGKTKDLDIDEIGDGNLNFVYKVSNSADPTKAVIVKQAVPYLRLAGESWPLARDRMRFEIRAFSAYNTLVPDYVPAVYHSDEDMSTIVMQYLGDHVILRTGMINGTRYPKVAEHTGLFMAETLFRTSAWNLGSVERRKLMNQFTLNSDLCKLTEDFIFTFPFLVHESNYSNIEMDTWVQENIHSDDEYKAEVLHLKELFVSKAEALLHGDLHSGSMMVNKHDTFVIDTEFAFYGPIAFDIGKVISNYLLCCTSHFHRSGGSDYREWILNQLPIVWNTFERRFTNLWEQAQSESALDTKQFLSEQAQANQRSAYLKGILQDSIGFAACSMARRTIGIAGVADIRSIEDSDVRATLEIFNLKLSKRLMSERKSINDFDSLMTLICGAYSAPILKEKK